MNQKSKYMIYLKLTRRLGFLFVGLILILSYQNCSNWGQVIGLKQGTQNGTSYGGMTGQNYFRFTKDWTCQGLPNFRAELSLMPQSITLTQNKMLQCGVVTNNIDTSTLDISPFQQNVIGYQEGIFERKSALPQEISSHLPTNLVEAWCRDSAGSDETIETVSSYDFDTKQATNQIFYKQNAQLLQTPITPVSRLVSWHRVEFKTSDSGFDLTIHRDQPSNIPGQFLGDLKAIIAGVNISKSVSCRLGADIDPDIWPSKILADNNIDLITVAPDNKHVAYSSQGLFVTATDGSLNQSIVTKPLSRAFAMSYTADSRKVIFSYNGNVVGATQLYSANADGSNFIQIGETLTSPTQGASQHYALTTDYSKIIYYDNSTKGAAGFVYLIRSAPINGGPSTLISQGLPIDSGLTQGWDFAVSPATGRVVFSAGNIYNFRYFSAYPDGSGLMDITPSYIPSQPMTSTQDCSGWCTAPITTGVFMGFSGISDFISLGAVFAASTSQPNYTQFMLNSDGTKMVPVTTYQSNNLGANFQSTSASGRYLSQTGGWWLTSFDQNNQFVAAPSKIFDMATQNTLTLPYINRGGFTNDSQFFFGNTPSSFGSSGAVYVANLNQWNGNYVCPASASSIVLAAGVGNANIVILSYSTTNQILSVYKQNLSTNEDCVLVNSLPILMSQLSEIVSSPDNSTVLVTTKNTDGGSNLLYIPLNGMPAYQVDTPTYHGALISGGRILSDSKTVIFWGQQTQSGLTNLYRWTAPDYTTPLAR